ncbi:MAG: 4-hydroxythreonine-4-phosphate dehydrogenase PdxA [Bacteroidales bacterium]|nr:4-hydroxythreonine-4-phosphate dehydrogenase PdxA [Bacteroidales bacterium]
MPAASPPNKSFKIGITHGDFNGISYEIILKTFSDSRMLQMLTPVLYGQSKVLSYYKKSLGVDDFNYSLVRDVRQSWQHKFNIVNITDDELKIEPGVLTEQAGRMATLSLKRVADDLIKGNLDAMVTSPLNPSLLKSESFKFNGQSDYLSSLFNQEDYLEMFVSDYLRIGMVTSDIPVKEAVSVITKEMVMHKLIILGNALKKDFNIASPKIAVLGLNPHAGDSGLAGTEEQDVIAPVVSMAQKNGLFAFGPFPSDRLFATGEWKKYDALLAMYHDQAALPFKMISVNGGAIYTAGLPIVRTTPFHGPAYDIANKNEASPESMRRAVFLALDILGNQKGD